MHMKLWISMYNSYQGSEFENTKAKIYPLYLSKIQIHLGLEGSFYNIQLMINSEGVNIHCKLMTIISNWYSSFIVQERNSRKSSHFIFNIYILSSKVINSAITIIKWKRVHSPSRSAGKWGTQALGQVLLVSTRGQFDSF